MTRSKRGGWNILKLRIEYFKYSKNISLECFELKIPLNNLHHLLLLGETLCDICQYRLVFDLMGDQT